MSLNATNIWGRVNGGVTNEMSPLYNGGIFAIIQL
jgi:hypothetical protein